MPRPPVQQEKLDAREAEIMALKANGMGFYQMCAYLGVSEFTLSTWHRANEFRAARWTRAKEQAAKLTKDQKRYRRKKAMRDAADLYIGDAFERLEEAFQSGEREKVMAAKEYARMARWGAERLDPKRWGAPPPVRINNTTNNNTNNIGALHLDALRKRAVEIGQEGSERKAIAPPKKPLTAADIDPRAILDAEIVNE